jgi:(E)-4-hydroxy-3-methylbut-2-enyl-diphosphate synthase
VGAVPVGGDSPIAVQSMTNTDTRDIRATVRQINRLADAGCEIVRLAIPDMKQPMPLRKSENRFHPL